MTASAAQAATAQGVTKVSPGSGPAVEVIDMESGIKRQAKRDAERLLRAICNFGMHARILVIAEELGIQVREADLDKNTLGALFMKAEEDPRIVVNKHDGALRQRLTCALEIGHFVRRSAESDEYARVDLRSGRTPSPEEKAEEDYAAEFAACLLMPEEEVRATAELGLDDLELALWFRVPRDVMRRRLDQLDLQVCSRWAA